MLEVAGHIAELALLALVLWLRKRDARANSTVRTGLSRIAEHTGALAEFVRSSLRPPPLRCLECDHPLDLHTSSMGELTKCGKRWCRCPHWSQPEASSPPGAVEFVGEPDDRTPVRRRGSARPEET